MLAAWEAAAVTEAEKVFHEFIFCQSWSEKRMDTGDQRGWMRAALAVRFGCAELLPTAELFCSSVSVQN